VPAGTNSSGASINRADIATVHLAQTTDTRFYRAAPATSN